MITLTYPKKHFPQASYACDRCIPVPALWNDVSSHIHMHAYACTFVYRIHAGRSDAILVLLAEHGEEVVPRRQLWPSDLNRAGLTEGPPACPQSVS